MLRVITTEYIPLHTLVEVKVSHAVCRMQDESVN